eukprot:gene3787-4712_t
MIRIAVRTLTLNIFKVEDDSMRQYIINSTAVPYFSNIVWFIRKQCVQLHTELESINQSNWRHEHINQLNYYVEELMDQFYYLHDIFNLGFNTMNEVLAQQFMQYLVFPLLLGSLLDPSLNPELEEERLTPTLALFLLAQVFHIFTYKPLLDTVANTLVSSSTSNLSPIITSSSTAPPPLSSLGSTRRHYNSFRRFSSFPNLNQLEDENEISKSDDGGYSDIESNKSSSPSTPVKKKHFFKQPSTPTKSNKDKEIKENNNNNNKDKDINSKDTNNNNNTVNNNNIVINILNSSTDSGSQYGSSLDESLVNEKKGIKINNNEDSSNTPPTTTTRTINNVNVSNGSVKTPNSTTTTTTNTNRNRDRNEFKEAIINLMNRDRETFGVVCMLYSFLKNSIIDQSILESGGVLPYRLAVGKRLLQGLLSPEPGHNQLSSSPGGNGKFLSNSLPANFTSHFRSRSESHAFPQLFSSDLPKGSIFGTGSGGQNRVIKNLKTSNNSNIDSSDSDLDQHLKEDTSSNGGSSVADLSTAHTHKQLLSSSLNPSTLSNIPTSTSTPTTTTTNTNTISPSKSPLLDEDEEEEFVPIPEHYHKGFTRKLINKLFFVLINSNQFRLITLQMTLLLLKELVYSPESPSKMTENQLALLEQAYNTVANNLKEYLTGNLSAIFLELFEEELRSYKQIYFESLVKDVALILPIPITPTPGLSLPRRLPSGESEKTQKAIQQFLVLRELKYTLLRRKDNSLPLRQPSIPHIKENDLFNLDTDSFDIIYYQVMTKDLKKKVKQCGVLFHNLLLAVDPNNAVPNTTAQKPGVYGNILHIAPLQRLEIELSHLDPTILRVTSHPTTWNVEMSFDEEAACSKAKLMLERARDDVRSSKMRQIYSLLGERDPDDDTQDFSLLLSTSSTPPRVIVPVDASNSHPLAFSDDDLKLNVNRSSINKHSTTTTTTTTTAINKKSNRNSISSTSSFSTNGNNNAEVTFDRIEDLKSTEKRNSRDIFAEIFSDDTGINNNNNGVTKLQTLLDDPEETDKDSFSDPLSGSLFSFSIPKNNNKVVVEDEKIVDKKPQQQQKEEQPIIESKQKESLDDALQIENDEKQDPENPTEIKKEKVEKEEVFEEINISTESPKIEESIQQPEQIIEQQKEEEVLINSHNNDNDQQQTIDINNDENNQHQQQTEQIIEQEKEDEIPINNHDNDNNNKPSIEEVENNISTDQSNTISLVENSINNQEEEKIDQSVVPTENENNFSASTEEKVETIETNGVDSKQILNEIIKVEEMTETKELETLVETNLNISDSNLVEEESKPTEEMTETKEPEALVETNHNISDSNLVEEESKPTEETVDNNQEEDDDQTETQQQDKNTTKTNTTTSKKQRRKKNQKKRI